MKQQTTIWQKMGLHDWFLKSESPEATDTAAPIAPADIFNMVIEKFHESIARLSFGNRIIFFHEYIVCFNPQDYQEFINNNKGMHGLIIHECVKKFYEVLKGYSEQGKTVDAGGRKWVFRFAAHPDYRRGNKSITGKLLPNAVRQQEENLRVTFIPRQTGMAESFDISNEILKDFALYSEGYYEIPCQPGFMLHNSAAAISDSKILARFETIIPDKGYAGKKIEYLMNGKDITVTGKEDKKSGKNIFRIPSEWVDTPHLQISYNKDNDKFYVVSFGEKTFLNELEMKLSKPGDLHWEELPFNSKMVLNGIVGINIFKA